MQRQDLFFAFRPDSVMADEIHALALATHFQNRLTGRLMGPERLHATLLPFQSYDVGRDGLPRDAVDRAVALGEAVCTEARPFDITFDRIGIFNGHGAERPIVLHCSHVPAAARSLKQALASAMGSDADKYEPHITLLWDRVPVPAGLLEKPVTLRVNNLVLIRSFYGKGHHQTFADWQLGQA